MNCNKAMQKRFLTSLFIVVCSFVQVYGYSDVYYIRKTVIESVNACGPVTVNASVIIATSTSGSGTYGPQKEYYVSAGTTWDEAVEIRSGYDCNGNSVSIHKEVVTKEEQYPNGVRFNGESSVYHYVKYITFYYTIGQGGGYSSSNSSSSSGSSSSNGNLTSSVERAGYTIGHAIGSGIAGVGKTLIKAGNSSAEKERKYGYHPGGFSLSASVSAAWGENLELRWRYGSSTIGGDVTCMVGYDWIRKDGILWNIGAGFSMGDRISEDYLFDVTILAN